MGRPRAEAGTRRRDRARSGGARVEVELTAEELARLDARRGDSSRAAYLRHLLAAE